MPSFMTRSIDSAVATPSMSVKNASLSMGKRMRFEMKPGKSPTTTGVFPNRSASATAAVVAVSAVSCPRTTSTSGMTGTGLKKCMPTTRSGCATTAARAVMEMLEVLDARMARGPSASEARRRRSRFAAWSSVTASIMMSASRAASSAPNTMRSSVASRAAGESTSFRTSRASERSMAARARACCWTATSYAATSIPAVASTWAMPAPMVPAPATTARRMGGASGGVNGDRERLAAAEAGGANAAPGAPALQLVEQGGHEARAATAEGVAKGDGAAVDVDPLGVPLKQLAVGHHLRGERLVDLQQIVVVERSTGLLEQLPDGRRGRLEQPERVERGVGRGDIARQGR